ncbi:hypothetical protein UFOVP87_11 [uncultured Caudovirales phage]|uniref:Uncharacterized protein n=1 Tax=uncultured Caudovirales phage TaxID=2100421 RepID=A0A6J5L2K3_9CAUD|nr:hypothetical protein UFOVP87_11 [uncultured Caudovirales phage]
MALPSVTINRLSGGIGRQGAGTDYYSGFLFYYPTGATLPTAFQSTPIKALNSITDLVALGVDGTSTDETKSTGTWLCSTAGVAGETVSLSFTDPFTGTTTVLATAIVPATPTTTTTATALKNAINANTYLNGFTATSSTATVTFTPGAGYGAALNSGTPYTITYSSTPTVAGTLTQNVVTGIGSNHDVLYYHVREAFRMQGILNGRPQGQIWVGCYNVSASPSTYANFTEVKTMQSFANGAIKQMGVYATTTAFATSHVTALQSRATELQALNTPLSIVYQGDFSATSDLTTLANLATLNSKNVSVTIGQDGGNVGKNLYKAYGKSIGMVGTTLGAIALAKVSDSLVWRDKFNAQDTLEYVTLAWANGTLQSASGSGLNALMTQVDLYAYTFLMPEIGINGSFFNNDRTCTLLSSDYSFIADNRTIDKEARGLRAAIIGSLGSPITYNSDGTLSADTVDYFSGLCDSFLNTMIANKEISASKTIIDPAQNVQSTGNLVVQVQNVQTGVARNIIVNIGYVAAIS